MKYLLLFTRGEWQENGTPDEVAKGYAALGPWFEKLWADGRVTEGYRLQGPETATTVAVEDGRSVLIDRPLLEAKEAIGGYVILTAADLDEAVGVARTLPVPDGKVEVRPLAED